MEKRFPPYFEFGTLFEHELDGQVVFGQAGTVDGRRIFTGSVAGKQAVMVPCRHEDGSEIWQLALLRSRKDHDGALEVARHLIANKVFRKLPGPREARPKRGPDPGGSGAQAADPGAESPDRAGPPTPRPGGGPNTLRLRKDGA